MSEQLDGVALVGMAGRFPDASSIEDFWALLIAGYDGISRFTPEQLSPSIPDSLRNNPRYVAARGVIADADRFDAAFFDIQAGDALLMDPQQRVLLELSWNALEHANVDPEHYPGRIGVYAGISNSGSRNLLDARPELIQPGSEPAAKPGDKKDDVAARIAHRLGLTGPAISLHTACSTSLVAVCQAWYALMSGQCDLALAGGINIVGPQECGYLPADGGSESADGVCRPYDAAANGTVFSSGGGMVALKRLVDAQANGDTIFAVLRGVGVNSDGADRAGVPAPHVRGQAAAIRRALGSAGVGAETIGYVEGHGTGSAEGDRIEVEALTRAYRENTDASQYCWLGSLKGNFGHLDAGSGVAGLMKAALALHYERIPPTLHYSTPNPAIDIGKTPFKVSSSAVHWLRSEIPRRAGVSSFGVGGTNAHVVLEEAPLPAPSARGRPASSLLLSARDESALRRRVADLACALEQYGDRDLPDLACTLREGRRHFPLRCQVTAATIADARASLARMQQVAVHGDVSKRPPLVFVFSGHGSQHANMSRGLMAGEPAFRDALEEACQIASALLGHPLLAVIHPPAGEEEGADALLARTDFQQPALFAVNYALARWWQSIGIEPDGMIGHGIGEYVAACLAGVFSLRDALALVVARATAIQALPEGAMLVVRGSAPLLCDAIPDGVEIAAIDAPERTVLAGSADAINRYVEQLGKANTANLRMRVSHPMHSTAMGGAVDRFRRAFAGITLHAPTRKFHSCASGKPITSDEATSPDYWCRQLRQPVRFLDAVRAAAEDNAVFLEVGPGQELAGAIARTDALRHRVIASLGQAGTRSSDAWHLIHAVGELACRGVMADNHLFHAGQRRRRLALPGYPFHGERYRVGGPTHSAPVMAADAAPSSVSTAPSLLPTTAPANSVVEHADVETAPVGTSIQISVVLPTSAQRQWIERFVARYSDKTARSKVFSQAHRQRRTDPRALGEFNSLWDDLVYPIVVERSYGSHLWDIDGNEYIDLLNSFGASFLGHHPEHIVRALEDQLDRGIQSGPYHPLIPEVADLVGEMTGMQRVAFCNADSDALMGAMRIARAVTNRKTIVIFGNSRHRIFDQVMIDESKPVRSQRSRAGNLDSVAGNFLVLDSGAVETLAIIRERGPELAAVMIEPVDGTNLALLPRDFILSLREMCDDASCALIFDEAMTGFRVAQGGAQEVYGVRADIATYGKLIGGGLPLAVIAGDAKWMDALYAGDGQFGDNSVPEASVRHIADSFVVNPLALAAARATLLYMKNAGPRLQSVISERSVVLVERLNENFRELRAPLKAIGFSSLWRIVVDQDQACAGLFWYELRQRGLHVDAPFTCCLTEAHGELEVDEIVDQVSSAVRALLDAKLLVSTDHAVHDSIDQKVRRADAVEALTCNDASPLDDAEGAKHLAGQPVGSAASTPEASDSPALATNAADSGAKIDAIIASALTAPPRIDARDAAFSTSAGSTSTPAAATTVILHGLESTIDPAANVPALIAAQAQATPLRIAVESGARRLTYAGLVQLIDALAAQLVELGVGRGERVGVCIPRAVELPIALLGVQRAGGAYVALDASEPLKHLLAVAKLSALRCIVTLDQGDVPVALAAGRRLIALNALDRHTAPTTQLPTLRGDDLATVSFDSSANGRPNGVRILQCNLVNFLASMLQVPGFSGEDALIAVTTLGVDSAGLELYLPLMCGARLVIADEQEITDPQALAGIIRDCDITTMQTTPTSLRMLLDGAGDKTVTGLKLLIGGEALPRNLASRALAHASELWSMHGWTETTIWSTVQRVHFDAPEVALGQPIANTSIRVLDAEGNAVGEGERGEIAIGGAGVGDGYLERSNRNAQCFVDAEDYGVPVRLFRSGDIGSIRDGRLYCHGRSNNQATRRNERIDLAGTQTRTSARPLPAVRDVPARPTSVGKAPGLSAIGEPPA